MSGSPTAQIALLGVGQVGAALLARLSGRRPGPRDPALRLAYVADSRHACCARRALGAAGRLHRTGPALPLPEVPGPLSGGAIRIVVDATASDAVAGHHADWLSRGVHVVTACKLGQGTGLDRWHAIRHACARSGARYGDRATVGAGLPLLGTLRALQAGGDGIHAIAGVLSGSLAWLLDRYDGTPPFSVLVDEARAAGYTEPDPRHDLSGEDVRRKLLILARTAGVLLAHDDVEVTPLPASDHAMRERLDDARARHATLQFVARLQRAGGRWQARAGIEALPAADPLAAGRGSDNRVAIWSDRYRDRPLVIQGPGAGAGVTAAALLDDVLHIARDAARAGVTARRWPLPGAGAAAVAPAA